MGSFAIVTLYSAFFGIVLQNQQQQQLISYFTRKVGQFIGITAAVLRRNVNANAAIVNYDAKKIALINFMATKNCVYKNSYKTLLRTFTKPRLNETV